MTECLLQKSPIKAALNDSDSNSGKEKDDFIKFDKVKETLKRIRPRSILKRNLSFVLYKLYSCQISIIIFSLLLGFLTLGLPLLLIYKGSVTNSIFPILFVCIFTLIFSILLIVIRFMDARKNYQIIIAKWERKNILKNIGISITLIILIVSVSLAINAYSKIIFYLNTEAIILDLNDSGLSNEIIYDFFFKYIFHMICFDPSKINENIEKYKIKYYFSDEDYIGILRNKFMALLIPLMIISFNKSIKCFLVEVKYPLEQFLFFFGSFLFFLFNIVINNYEKEKLLEFNINIISCFQIILIGIIYIGYNSWTLHISFRFIENPKDKNFAINEYFFFNQILILLFDLLSLLGSTFSFFSFLFFYLSIYFGNENFKNLKRAFNILKIGFLLIIIGNSYYFGHYLLSMIFRPISIQYAPYELKNKSYIKANRRLLNTMITKKKEFKIKELESDK